MKTYIDRKKIATRAEIANTASIGGLVLLLASVLLPLFVPKLAGASFWLMVAGLGIAMVGIYFANRWVRKPRPEDSLDKALKGLADSYHLFHYPAGLPCDHLILNPNGVVVLETVALPGVFDCKDGKIKESMTIGRAIRYIVEERVGDPVGSATRTVRDLRQRLEIVPGVSGTVPVKPVVTFVHPYAHLTVESAPIPVTAADKLKKHVTIEEERLAPEVYDALDAYFQSLTVKK